MKINKETKSIIKFQLHLLIWASTILLMFTLFLLVLFLPNIWECKNLETLYKGTFEVKYIFPNGCLVNYKDLWIDINKFENFLNINMVK